MNVQVFDLSQEAAQRELAADYLDFIGFQVIERLILQFMAYLKACKAVFQGIRIQSMCCCVSAS